MNTSEIIAQVNNLKDSVTITKFAADLFETHLDLDDSVLDAIEAQLAIYYTPTAKDKALENLTKGYEKFRKYAGKRNYQAAARQAKKNKRLQEIYDGLK